MHPGVLKCSAREHCLFSNHKLQPASAVDLPIKYKDIVNIAQKNVLSGATEEVLGFIILNPCKIIHNDEKHA